MPKTHIGIPLLSCTELQQPEQVIYYVMHNLKPHLNSSRTSTIYYILQSPHKYHILQYHILQSVYRLIINGQFFVV